MSLEDTLQDKRKAIMERWLDLVLADYSPDTSKFLKNKKDQFGNPVGHTLIQGLDVLCAALIEDRNDDEVAATLEDVIRIRAVQELAPSVGVGFLLSIKQAVAKVAGKQLSAKELRTFDQRVDVLSLQAFDIYMACRTKLFEIRIDDLRRNHLDIREQVALRKAKRAETTAPLNASETATDDNDNE